MFHPKDTNFDIPSKLDEDQPETSYLLRKYRYDTKNVIFECFQDEIS